jgi:2-polyprenyl-3-methyl-5-hydroxy-6-metoxy-1,4-benzoquinol methylase
MATTLEYPEARIHLDELAGGKRRVCVQASDPSLYVHVTSCDTAYPEDLIRAIADVKGPGWLCDEIMREESPQYVRWDLGHSILGFVDAASLSGKRIMDFGCGSGASSVILARMFPQAEILGIELEEPLLGLARMRAKHYGLNRLTFARTPSGLELPPGVGEFDAVVMSEVYEHLLPDERRTLMPRIWSTLRPGGILFITAPCRYFVIESHTSGLPLLNYLPDRLAMALAKRARKDLKNDSWDVLLRRGIRGGTVRGIMKSLRLDPTARPVLLKPNRLGFKDQADVWHACSTAAGRSLPKLMVWAVAKVICRTLGIYVMPQLELAIEKRAVSER